MPHATPNVLGKQLSNHRALQIADLEPRVAQKALRLCASVCLEAPQLRTAIASASGFLSQLAQCLDGSDELTQAAALALLAELVDSQSAIKIAEGEIGLKRSYCAARGAFLAKFAEDADAFEQEKMAIDTVDSRTRLADDPLPV
jgi:hypothetical protein